MRQVSYSIMEAARALGVGRSTVYGLLQSGELRSFYVGKRRLISAIDLARFVKARLRRSTT